MSERTARRPSAALVLGVLSGVVAAVAVLPTAIPLTSRMSSAERALAEQYTATAIQVATRDLADGDGFVAGEAQRLGMDLLQVRGPDGLIRLQEGPQVDEASLAVACDSATHSATVDIADERWALSCAETADGSRVVIGLRPRFQSAAPMFYLVVTLSAIVGIVTALGVLRILYPVSQLSRALTRVGAGERGVRAYGTGFEEFDDLVDRLNDAARAMEDREDAVMARIRAVQETARLVAHEVRNPLQSLELLTSLIASESDQMEREQLAKAIHAEIRTLDMVVTRVLREGAGRGAERLQLLPARQKVEPILRHVLAIRDAESKVHGVRIERGPIDPSAEASFDAALIGRSMENLIINAVQACPRTDGMVRVSLESADGGFRFTVEDNGAGVDSAFGAAIFEPNVSGRTGGTGLGLALVKQVVDAHGGRIGYDRSSLGGAIFAMTIPSAPPLSKKP